ncbi:type VI secretion system contractile sheath small subunit, partial [Salmonella enterica subsp. enterica serovar Indiana]|nr:type VI secretion system contractile sheath small subunit [Salmonella enterica subsp. enterica serovar Indiana]
LVNKLLQDPTLLKTLANAPKPAAAQEGVPARDAESAE